MPRWRPDLCCAPFYPSLTTTLSKTPKNCSSLSSTPCTTTSKRCSRLLHSPHTASHTSNLCVYVDKVAKHMRRASMQQPRQDQNRNCATAAGDTTVVSHLFEGQLGYMTLCMHCDHQGHNTQTFTVLSLPIPTRIKCSIQVRGGGCRWPQHFSFDGDCLCLCKTCLTVILSVLGRTACPCFLSRPS